MQCRKIITVEDKKKNEYNFINIYIYIYIYIYIIHDKNDPKQK